MPGESKLEKEIVAHATSLGMLSFKFTSPSQKGVPDRIFIHEGHVLFLEIKAPKKKPSQLQWRMLLKFRKFGAACFWVNNFTDACDILEYFRNFPNQFNSFYPL